MNLRHFASRQLAGNHVDHVRIDHAGHVIRLDVEDGIGHGPFALSVELPIGIRTDAQVDATLVLQRLLSGRLTSAAPHRRNADAMFRLWAHDLRGHGASLREIADILMGPGDWPGDGECRKSQVRRLVRDGRLMVEEGPKEILWGP